MRRYRSRLLILAIVTAAAWLFALQAPGMRELVANFGALIAFALGVLLCGMLLVSFGFLVSGATARVWRWFVNLSQWPSDERF
jgi:hypothetical protein